MPINSDKIRITVDLPREEYQAMHQLAERKSVTHTLVVRQALEREIRRAQIRTGGDTSTEEEK